MSHNSATKMKRIALMPGARELNRLGVSVSLPSCDGLPGGSITRETGALVHESDLARHDPSLCRSLLDGVRRRPATVNHLIGDLAGEDSLRRLPRRTARMKATPR